MAKEKNTPADETKLDGINPEALEELSNGKGEDTDE